MENQHLDFSSWELSPHELRISSEKNENSSAYPSNVSLEFDDILNSNLPLPPPPGFQDRHPPEEDELWQKQQKWFEDQIQQRQRQEQEYHEQLQMRDRDRQQFVFQDPLPPPIFHDPLHSGTPVYPPFEYSDVDDYEYQPSLEPQSSRYEERYNPDEHEPNENDDSYFGLIDSLDGDGENVLDWETYERATDEIWNLRSTIRSRSVSDLFESFQNRLPQANKINHSSHHSVHCHYKYSDPYDASGGEEMEESESESRSRSVHRTDKMTTVHTTPSSASSLTSVRVLVSQQSTKHGNTNENLSRRQSTKYCPCYECRRRKSIAVSSTRSLTELDNEINYIQKNIKDLKKYKKAAPIEPKVIAVTHKGHKKPPLERLMGKPGFGKVPEYIIKRKEEIIKAKQDAAMEAANLARQQAQERRKLKQIQLETANAKKNEIKEQNQNQKAKVHLKKQLKVGALLDNKAKKQTGLSTRGNSVYISRYKSPPPDLRMYPEFPYDLSKLSGPKDKNNPNHNKLVSMWMTKNNGNINIKPPQSTPENIMMKIVLKKEEIPDSEIFSNLQSLAQLRKGTLSAPARGYPPILVEPPEANAVGVYEVSSTPLPQSRLPKEIDSTELINLVNSNYGYDLSA